MNLRTLRVVLGLATIVAPLALISGYLYVTQFFPRRSGLADVIAVVLSAGAGALAQWPIWTNARWRLLGTLAYGAGTVVHLSLYSLVFVCGVFGDCL